MTHEELKSIYKDVFFPDGIEFNLMAELANLTVIIYNSVKKKEPDVTVYDILKRVNGSTGVNYDLYFIPLALMLEVFLERGDLMFKPNLYGFKTSKEITDRIKEILDKNFLPF